MSDWSGGLIWLFSINMHVVGIDIDKASLFQSESDSQMCLLRVFAVFFFVFLRLWIQEKNIPQFPLQSLSVSIKDLYTFFLKYTFILDHFFHSQLLFWAGCLEGEGSSVTFERLLPSSLRECGAHRLKIKTSTVISCSSGCFPKKECRYELCFPPPLELIIGSQPFSGLHVSWWSQEQASKEAE